MTRFFERHSNLARCLHVSVREVDEFADECRARRGGEPPRRVVSSVSRPHGGELADVWGAPVVSPPPSPHLQSLHRSLAPEARELRGAVEAHERHQLEVATALIDLARRVSVECEGISGVRIDSYFSVEKGRLLIDGRDVLRRGPEENIQALDRCPYPVDVDRLAEDLRGALRARAVALRAGG